jgi:hypothetical protein
MATLKPWAGEIQRNGFADPARGAGNKCDFVESCHRYSG